MRLAFIAIFLSLVIAAIIPARKAFTILPMEPAPRGTFLESLNNWITDTRIEVESQSAAQKHFACRMEGSPDALRELNFITNTYQRFSPFLYFLRAREKHMLKDYAGALKDYELVQNHLPPGFPSDNCHFWKGDIFEFDLQDYRRAELEYSAVINSNAPRAQLSYFNRGFVRQKMGKYRDAIEDYTMFATYVGRRGVLDTYAMGQRAECYAAIGDKNAARADALKAIARATEELKESSYPADFFERGKMRILIGDIKGGRKDLETTLELLQALEKNSKDKSRQEFVSEVTCRMKGLSSTN